jgi:hypothetical protein
VTILDAVAEFERVRRELEVLKQSDALAHFAKSQNVLAEITEQYNRHAARMAAIAEQLNGHGADIQDVMKVASVAEEAIRAPEPRPERTIVRRELVRTIGFCSKGFRLKR